MENNSPNTGLILSCPLCEEHSCHVIGSDEAQIMQCINCGYVSSNKYLGTKKTNKEYKKLEPDMQKWAKEGLERVWIPTIMTLPTGLIYPFDDENGNMKWGYAKMVNITKEEQKDYPIPGQDGKFYEQRYDMDSPKIFDEFIFAMSELQSELKQKHEKEQGSIKLEKTDNGSSSKNITLPK